MKAIVLGATGAVGTALTRELISQIITPENTYGITQALTLKFYPYLDPLFKGTWTQYRSIKVEVLGRVMALNCLRKPSTAVEILTWKDFQEIRMLSENHHS